MRKTTQQWISFDFNVSVQEPSAEQHLQKHFSKPMKVEKHSQRQRPAVMKRNAFDFEGYIKPKMIADLAVHPKKVKEVEQWLQNNVRNKPTSLNKNNFLLITGPTGSGKTATIHVLCDNMNISITEWSNPVDQDFELCRGSSQITRFSEFISESRWNSLLTSNQNKIILIEEFPNILLRNPVELAAVLENCCSKLLYPVIFICTDSCDNHSISQTLFPPTIIEQYRMVHVSFNPCATTMIKNALRRAHELVEQHLDLFKIPSVVTVNAIVATSMGDLRCAINQYYFASLLGSNEISLSVERRVQKSGTKRKRNDNNYSVKAMFRDGNLGLFHGIGRVLNPKRLEQVHGSSLNCDFEKLIDEFSTLPRIFTGFLFENYLKYFGKLDDVIEASEELSLSQTFLDHWIDRQEVLIFSMWISVLGLMIYNKHKISKWNQITGPKKIEMRKINEDQLKRRLSNTDLFYYNIIAGDQNSHFSIK